jgi:hypothetical protein
LRKLLLRQAPATCCSPCGSGRDQQRFWQKLLLLLQLPACLLPPA